MKELLGFAVLTGPLWLILIALILGIVAAFIVAKRMKSGGAKLATVIAILAGAFLILFGDELAGRAYLNYLCATEAGVKVYQTVELPGEYWDSAGNAKFLKPNGDLDKAMLGGRFSEPAKQNIYVSIFGIDEYQHQVVDNSSHQKLGEVKNFLHWGGWISRNFNPGGPSAIDCERLHGSRFWRDFYSSLFVRPPSSSLRE